jgi:hypothetical protein
MVSLRLESAESVLFFMPFKHVRARRDEFVYPLSNVALKFISQESRNAGSLIVDLS